jgi:thymidine kinase
MSLELIVGCMFSGKSTEIIRTINRLQMIDSKYMLIKPQIDTRYSPGTMISTHDNLQRKCIVLRNLIQVFDNPDYQKSEHIIIEEAQFFDDLEPFVIKAVDEDKKRVVVIGLDGDSDRKNFGQIHKLLPLCDTIRKLKAFCSECKDGTEAIFSKRHVNEGTQTNIGSSDKYKAVCRECFLRE